MTKKNSTPTIASIFICSLALCNCSTIQNYRKDPSEWNAPVSMKPKVVNVSKKSDTKKKSEGFFSFFKRASKDPQKNIKTDIKPVVVPALADNLKTNVSTLPTISAPSTQPGYVKRPTSNSYPTLPTADITNISNKTRTGVKGERRKIGRLLSPNADKLPTDKDLQEIQSTIPSSGQDKGVKIPIKP